VAGNELLDDVQDADGCVGCLSRATSGIVSVMTLAVLIGGGVVAVGLVVLWLSRNNDVTVVDVAPPRPPTAKPAITAAPTSPVVVQGAGPVHDLLRAGRKIEAIKAYKELTGVGLKEAKDAVDALERGEPVAVPIAPPPLGPITPNVAVDDRELREHLRADRLIDAIKRYRELTGLGLKESKDAVEALRDARKS
jgi:ribosomal protein L7/L12